MQNSTDLESLFDSENPDLLPLERLRKFLTADDPELRFLALQKLDASELQTDLALFAKLLQDIDELVKVECIELVGEAREDEFLDIVVSLLEDQSVLVRSAAAWVIGRLNASQYVSLLNNFVNKAISDREKVGAFHSLAVLDKPNQQMWLDQLFSLLHSPDYQSRSATINLLANDIELFDKHLVRSALENAVIEEKIPSVKLSIMTALNAYKVQ